MPQTGKGKWGTVSARRSSGRCPERLRPSVKGSAAVVVLELADLRHLSQRSAQGGPVVLLACVKATSAWRVCVCACVCVCVCPELVFLTCQAHSS